MSREVAFEYPGKWVSNSEENQEKKWNETENVGVAVD